MIYIKKPKKLKDYYISEINTDNKKTLRIKINNIKWVNINLPLCKIWIDPKNTIIEDLIKYDKEVYEQTLFNNSKWFPNALSEEKIKEFFRESINKSYSTITVLYSEWAPPIIYNEGEIIDKLEITNVATNIDIELEAEGVCFFKHRFGIRWILKKVWITNNKQVEEDTQEWIDREEIHNSWQEDIVRFKMDLIKQREELKKKEQDLEILEKEIDLIWEKTKKYNDNNWNEELENISKIIHKYSLNH